MTRSPEFKAKEDALRPKSCRDAAGKLQASLGFAQIDEILAQDTARYLRDVLGQCRIIQELIYRLYISYSVDTALTV